MIIKLPKRNKASKTVKETLRRVLQASEENGWTHVVIIGRGKTTDGVYHSKMDVAMVLGMMEIAKDVTLDNF